MNAEYRRDIHHSYLVLYEPEAERNPSFRERMFLENRIPGLLQCKMHKIDRCGRFFYDISSRQSLSNVLETRTLDQTLLEALVRSILTALDGLQEYLLDTEGLTLRPEWIFLKPSEDAFEFCYFPVGTFSWKEEFRKLAEYLLPHLEHKNREAVRLGYALYQSAVEEKTTVSELEQLLTKSEEQEKKEVHSSHKEPVSEGLPGNRSELLNAFFEPEQKESGPIKSETAKNHREVLSNLLLLLPAVLGSGGAFLCWYLGMNLPAAACGTVGVLVSASLFLQNWKKVKDQETDSRMEQYVMVQDWMEEEKLEEQVVQQVHQNQGEQEEMTCFLGGSKGIVSAPRGYLVPQISGGGPAIPVEKKVTMIGKSSRMDVILPAPSVSRTHARITGSEDGCFLTDMNSKNGTKVNGVLLDPEEQRSLSDGDRIDFADQRYEWKKSLLPEAPLFPTTSQFAKV